MMSMKRLWESVEIGNKVRESVTCCLDSRLSQSRTPGQGADPEDGLGNGISLLSRSRRGWSTGRGMEKRDPSHGSKSY